MRATTTVLLTTAGAAWLAGQAVLPDLGTTWEERYAAVADARHLEALSAGLFVVAGAALVLGALAVSRRAVGRRTVTVGAALTALGGLWLVGGRAAFNLTFYRVTEATVARDVAVDVLEAPVGPGFVPLVLLLPALLVGPALLAIGSRGPGAAGWLPLACWVVGLGVFLGTEFASKAGEVGGIAVAALGLALVGRAVDRSRTPVAALPDEQVAAPARV